MRVSGGGGGFSAVLEAGGSVVVEAFGALGGSEGRSKGVRCSDGGIRGKEIVEKRKRSRGWDEEEWIIKEVLATVH